MKKKFWTARLKTILIIALVVAICAAVTLAIATGTSVLENAVRCVKAPAILPAGGKAALADGLILCVGHDLVHLRNGMHIGDDDALRAVQHLHDGREPRLPHPAERRHSA